MGGQPSAPYNTNNVPADIRANMPANSVGTFSDNNDIYSMPTDPEYQPQRTNPNKWEDYYKEDNTPEPPPLPKGQENPFEVTDPKIKPPESKDMLPPPNKNDGSPNVPSADEGESDMVD